MASASLATEGFVLRLMGKKSVTMPKGPFLALQRVSRDGPRSEEVDSLIAVPHREAGNGQRFGK